MFLQCSNLQTVNIPDGTEHISTECFSNCTSLHEIELPETVTFIHQGAFANCINLKTITIPPGVTTIEEHSIGFERKRSDAKRIEGIVLRGKTGSAAEIYAKQSGILFEPV